MFVPRTQGGVRYRHIALSLVNQSACGSFVWRRSLSCCAAELKLLSSGVALVNLDVGKKQKQEKLTKIDETR